MTIYWHGGAPYLGPGDMLLPPSRTGQPFTLADESVRQGRDLIAQRRDRVYITTDRVLALAYASGWSADGEKVGFGWLYVVDAETLEPDADLLSVPGLSFQAPQARIIRVEQRFVRPYQPRLAQRLAEVLAEQERAQHE